MKKQLSCILFYCICILGKAQSLPNMESLLVKDSVSWANKKTQVKQQENPLDTKYFFGSSAIALKKGDKMYNNHLLISNMVDFGLTNHISLGVGLLGLVPSARLKISEEFSKDFHFGVGVHTIQVYGMGNLSAVYMSTTFGDEKDNFTISYGQGLAIGEVVSNEIQERSANVAYGNFSGKKELKNGYALVTENYFFNVKEQVNGVSFAGLRIPFSKGKTMLDLGGVFLVNEDDFLGFPIVGLAVGW